MNAPNRPVAGFRFRFIMNYTKHIRIESQVALGARTSEVGEAMSNLNNSCSELLDLLNNLQERLNPVMNQKDGELESPERCGKSSPLAEAISRQTDRINGMSNRVRRMLDALEI